MTFCLPIQRTVQESLQDITLHTTEIRRLRMVDKHNIALDLTKHVWILHVQISGHVMKNQVAQ